MSEACPCCNADKLAFSPKMEEQLGKIYGIGLDAQITVRLADRWDCDCWKRPTCTSCKRCVFHCEHVNKAPRVKPDRVVNAAIRKETADKSVTLPFTFPKKEEPKPVKGHGKRKT